jgi:hypothetical protein
MTLYDPNKTKFLLPRDGFLVDSNKLELVISKASSTKILWLPPDLAKEIAPRMTSNPNSMYFAMSGVKVDFDYGGQFLKGKKVLAVEHVRFETNPNLQKSESDFNLNRYIFGVSPSDNKAYGIDVTTWLSNDVTSQVGNHWDDISAYVNEHFPHGQIC